MLSQKAQWFHGTLVHRPICSWHMAAGQLVVFQGATRTQRFRLVGCGRSDEHPSRRTYGASNAEKRPTGRGPEGCLENGPAAAGSVTYRFRYAPSLRPAAAGPSAHFERNHMPATYETMY
jgi:hypothetical protein